MTSSVETPTQRVVMLPQSVQYAYRRLPKRIPHIGCSGRRRCAALRRGTCSLEKKTLSNLFGTGIEIWEVVFSARRRLPTKQKILVIIPAEPNRFPGSAAAADDVLEKVHLLFPFTFHLSAGDVIG
jgi:hypothetical protein